MASEGNTKKHPARLRVKRDKQQKAREPEAAAEEDKPEAKSSASERTSKAGASSEQPDISWIYRQRIVDAHVHFTNRGTLKYSWLPNVPELDGDGRDWTPDDLASEMKGEACQLP